MRLSIDKTLKFGSNIQGSSKSPEQLPHNESAAAVVVFDIVSLVLSWLPIIGLVLAIVRLIFNRQNRKFAE